MAIVIWFSCMPLAASSIGPSCQTDLVAVRFPPPALVEDLAGFDLGRIRADEKWIVVEVVPSAQWSCQEIEEWHMNPHALSSLFTMTGTMHRVEASLGKSDTEVWDYSYLKSELDTKLRYWPLFALGGSATILIDDSRQQLDVFESVVPIPSAWLEFMVSALERFERRRINGFLHSLDTDNAVHENPFVAIESYRDISSLDRNVRRQHNSDDSLRAFVAKYEYFFKSLSVARAEALRQSRGLRRAVFTFLSLQDGRDEYREVFTELDDLVRRAGDVSELTGVAAGAVAFLASGPTGVSRAAALHLLDQIQEQARRVPGDAESVRYIDSLLHGFLRGPTDD